MSELKIVYLEISSWAGVSLNAEHYYGKLVGHDADGEYLSFEMEWPLSQKMATQLNKKDSIRGTDHFRHKSGNPTYRFDTSDEVKEWAISTWRDRFTDSDLLIDGSDCINEPKEALDGDDAELILVINDLFTKYEKLDDLRFPFYRKMGDALSTIFHRVIKSGDHKIGRASCRDRV